MPTNLAPPSAFEGFASPNYIQVPDELFDLLLPTLADNELRVLLYIIRRTFGFKREADAISLSQMVSGITRRGHRARRRHWVEQVHRGPRPQEPRGQRHHRCHPQCFG
jgi:hypothetical protein